MFSNDVCLTFGLDKYAKSSARLFLLMISPCLMIVLYVHALGVGESYQYLGFEGLDCVKSKEMLINSYYHCLKLVWNSLLSGPRKTRATNSFCVPLLT